MKNYLVVFGFIIVAFALYLIWGNLHSQIVALESETGSYIYTEGDDTSVDPYDFTALREQLVLLQQAQAKNTAAIDAILRKLGELGGTSCSGDNCVGKIIRRAIVSFGHDERSLSDAARNKIDSLLATMRDSTLVSLRGHADTRGNNQYNQLLSLQRAAAVKRYIDTRRNADNRLRNLLITIDGVGEESTIKQTADEVGEPSNRIVEILIYE